ncbi:MAG: flippase-like domain-containing protein [Chitinivibrionales bacterium]|nr:flippase-like domain-containing protein [Chitinivibrionales bacterium]
MKYLKFLVKLIISIGLVVWIFFNIEMKALAGAFSKANIVFLLIGVIMVFARHLTNCFRWRECLFDNKNRVPFSYLLFSYFPSLVIGHIFPTEYGGDILRINDINKKTGNMAQSIGSVFFSRLSGLVTVAIVFIFISLIRFETIPLPKLSLFIVLAACFLVIVFLVIFSDGFLKKMLIRTGVIQINKITSGKRFNVALSLIPDYRKHLPLIVFFSLLSILFMTVTNWMLVRSIGHHVSFSNIVILISVLSFISIVPISIGGIGIKEATFILFFKELGISAEDALAIGLLNRSIQIIFLMGAAVLFPIRNRFMK